MAETSYGPANDATAYNAGVGYRSGAIADVGAGTSTGRSKVSYNGFEFPPTSQIQLTVVQEYDDPKRTVKYLTIAITVTCVITTIDLDTTTYNNTDAIMDFIRTRLSANGQPLQISDQGLGNLSINVAGVADFSDVDYGPKPQVQEMRPIAGQRAVNLIWLCTTRIPACSNINQQGILQSYFTAQFDETTEGIGTRTISGKVEQSRIRPPNPPNTTGNNQAAETRLLTGLADLTNEMSRILLMFPPIGGYKRTFTEKFSAGGSVLDYTITDTQYPSSYPMFPPVIQASITQSLFSKFIDQGFKQWNLTFSGSLTVPKPHDLRHNTPDLKKEAWTWLGLFIIERLKRAKGKKYRTKKDGSEDKPSGKVYHIPVSIQINDSIYSNSFSFTFKFLLMCGTDILFAATGMFDPADLPGLTWDANRNRLTTLRAIPDNLVRNNIKSLRGLTTIIDLCNAIQSDTGTSQADGTPKSGIDLIASVDPPKEDESMLDYRNDYEDEVENSSIYSRPLGNFEPQLEKIKDDIQKRLEKEFTPSPDLQKGQDSENSSPGVIVRHAKPRHIVTMRGHAVRMGFPIDAPNLVKYGGRTAFKYGTDRVRQSKLAIGALQRSGNTEGTTTIYRLDWEKTYILEDVPGIGVDSAVDTDGHPEIFV